MSERSASVNVDDADCSEESTGLLDNFLGQDRAKAPKLASNSPRRLHFWASGDWSVAVWRCGRAVSVVLNLCALVATICWLLQFHSAGLLPPSTTPIADAEPSRLHPLHTGIAVSDSVLLLSLNGSDALSAVSSHLCIDELSGRWGNHVYIIMMAVTYAHRHNLTLHLPPFETRRLLAHADLFTAPCPTNGRNVTIKQDGQWWLHHPRTSLLPDEQDDASQPVVAHVKGYFQVSSAPRPTATLHLPHIVDHARIGSSTRWNAHNGHVCCLL